MSDIFTVLNRKNIEYIKNPNSVSEILIKCTSGLHEDSNPSLHYNLEKNIFHCFSCGFSGSYKKLLQSIGENSIVEIETKQAYKIKKLKNKITDKYFKTEITLPKDAINFNFDFKGVDGKVIQEFGAFTTNQMGLSDYICFPIYQFGKLRFIEGRFKLLNIKTESPKYYRQPATGKTSDLLFPLDKINDKSHLILVEGLFDMLNLWQHGYKNTVCIFGTANFKQEKVTLIDNLGVKKVTVFMDNDLSGNRAAENIVSLLEAKDIETLKILAPPNKDPGELTKEELMNIFGEEYA
jgi:DNA primase